MVQLVKKSVTLIARGTILRNVGDHQSSAFIAVCFFIVDPIFR